MSTMYRVAGRNLTPEEIKKEMSAYGRVRAAWELKVESSQVEMKRIGYMLLANEDGKLLLNILEEMFYNGEMVADTTEKTFVNLGKREVVQLLRSLRDQAKET